jgi:hypothetical protein
VAVEAVQRRTVRTLVAAQIIGGLGIGGGVAVGALLASSVLGRPDLAGLVQSAQVLGSALLAIPAAAMSQGYMSVSASVPVCSATALRRSASIAANRATWPCSSVG